MNESSPHVARLPREVEHEPQQANHGERDDGDEARRGQAVGGAVRAGFFRLGVARRPSRAAEAMARGSHRTASTGRGRTAVTRCMRNCIRGADASRTPEIAAALAWMAGPLLRFRLNRARGHADGRGCRWRTASPPCGKTRSAPPRRSGDDTPLVHPRHSARETSASLCIHGAPAHFGIVSNVDHNHADYNDGNDNGIEVDGKAPCAHDTL